MDEELTDILAPEVSAAEIFECSGVRLEPEAARGFVAQDFAT